MLQSIKRMVLYTGPMDAGKTTVLYHTAKALQATRRPYVTVLPSFDIRSKGLLVPKVYHRGNRHPSLTEQHGVQIASILDLSPDDIQGIRTVIIDEWTLFGFQNDGTAITEYFEASLQHLSKLGITEIYAAGLNVPANTQPFPMLIRAIGCGAEVHFLTALCMADLDGPTSPTCGATARNTQIYSIASGRSYIPASLPALLPEGKYPDLGYRPVCMEHLHVRPRLSRDFRLDYSF